MVLLVMVLIFPAAHPVQASAGSGLLWNNIFGTKTVCFGIAADGAGNFYATGESKAAWGNPLNAFTGTSDVFIAKFDSSGTLIWNTFFPTDVSNTGGGIVLDSIGNIYVTGTTYGHIGWEDAFVVKLNNSGAVQWATYLGSPSGTDRAFGIAVDAAGNIFVCGESNVSWGTTIRRHYTGDIDAFVAKLDSDGTPVWNTFLGSSAGDKAYGITADRTGNTCVTGYSYGNWGSPILPFTSGSSDTFVVKLTNDGTLTWQTFLGGISQDQGQGIAADNAGNVYVAGTSLMSWGSPIRPFTPSSDPENPNDAFVAKLTSNGNLIWNTFLGGTGLDIAYGIAVDAAANSYTCGMSSATWGLPWLPYAGGSEVWNANAFVAKLSNSGTLQWNAFLRGDLMAISLGIALDPSRNVGLAGAWNASWGGSSGFVAKIAGPFPAITSFTPTSGGNGTQVVITGQNFTDVTSVNFGGIPATSFTVDSDTLITAVVGSGDTGKITVTSVFGTAVSAADFTFVRTVNFISTMPHGSSAPGTGPTGTQQEPILMSAVSVRSAQLSDTRVSPGMQVTVTADTVNKGPVNGNKKVTLYINGQVETTQSVTVNSGGSSKLTFNVSRSEPGDYSVYVDGVPAGSFKVELFRESDGILIFSSCLVGLAFILGMVMLWRRQRIG
jgi:hypothetical protein